MTQCDVFYVSVLGGFIDIKIITLIIVFSGLHSVAVTKLHVQFLVLGFKGLACVL